MGGYYLPRMALLVDRLKEATHSNRLIDLGEFWVSWVALTERFQNGREAFPLHTEGEPVAVSVKLYAMYSKLVTSEEYQVQPNARARDLYFSGANLWQQQ